MGEIECLLVGYRGILYDPVNKEIKNRNINNLTIEKVFNGAIAYLGTYLSRRGFTFDYINYFEDDYEELAKKLRCNNVKSVGFSTTFCTSVDALRECVKFIRSVNPNTKIILGGTFIAKFLSEADKEKTRETHMMLKYINADYYIDSFQGEATLCDILRSLKGELTTVQVPNIYYKHEGKYFYTRLVPEDNDLEENMVDWSLFSDRVGKVVPVRTSISCPFSCAYCSFPVNAGRYRYVSIEAIERELDSINQIDKIRSVSFIDDTFNVPAERFKELLRLMIRKKYTFKWHSYLRCQYIDRETVELMKESKCEGVLLGIESGSQKMLDVMNKRVNIEELKRGIALLHEYNIVTVGMFFIGFPGETHDTVKETLDFINNQKFTFYEIQPWFYDPRTPISKEKEKYDINGAYYDWSHMTMDFDTANMLVGEVVSSVNSSRFCIDCETLFQCLNAGEQIINDLDIEKMMLDAREKNRF